MKPYHSLIIFIALMVSAICASVNSYRCAEGDIISDMNQALVVTLHDSHYQWLTPDASETLYTLIRRVKPIVEAYGLAIEVERGRAYRLIRTK